MKGRMRHFEGQQSDNFGKYFEKYLKKYLEKFFGEYFGKYFEDYWWLPDNDHVRNNLAPRTPHIWTSQSKNTQHWSINTRNKKATS